MALRFNPPKNIGRYALFVDHGEGRGFFKSYDLLGSAKNSFHNKHNQYGAKILENVNGEWFTLYDIPAGSEAPWLKEVAVGYGHPYPYSTRNYTIKRSKPMTRDEYADWRLKVEHERLQQSTAFVPSNFEV